ncbi:hypothetical protein HDV00_007434, partial [Rhizophlyctis rosea]
TSVDTNFHPAPQNSSFTYEFNAAHQAGTFWYHSHVRSQYPDGAKGAFVIYDPNDPIKKYAPYDVDNENTVMQLSDWFHSPSPALLRAYFSPSNVGSSAEPPADGGLINGFGRCAVDCPSNVPYYTNTVEKGKAYRMRVINTSAHAKFTFSIDNHNLEVIELDGVTHLPKNYTGFEIWPGQRVSFILRTTQPISNYWIRAKMETPQKTKNFIEEVLGILRYSGAAATNPTTSKPSLNLMKEMELVPLEKGEVGPIVGGRGKADLEVTLEFANTKTVIDGAERTAWTLFGQAYHGPKVPTLAAVLYNNARTKADFPADSNVVVLDKPNMVVDIIMKVNKPGVGHPFHLHGHVFSVLSNGGTSATVPATAPIRDVIAVQGSGARVRFIADNPGTWFLHCHIDWHLEAGLAMVFVERPSEIPGRVNPPAEWKELCVKYDALPLALQ